RFAIVIHPCDVLELSVWPPYLDKRIIVIVSPEVGKRVAGGDVVFLLNYAGPDLVDCRHERVIQNTYKIPIWLTRTPPSGDAAQTVEDEGSIQKGYSGSRHIRLSGSTDVARLVLVEGRVCSTECKAVHAIASIKIAQRDWPSKRLYLSRHSCLRSLFRNDSG